MHSNNLVRQTRSEVLCILQYQLQYARSTPTSQSTLVIVLCILLEYAQYSTLLLVGCRRHTATLRARVYSCWIVGTIRLGPLPASSDSFQRGGGLVGAFARTLARTQLVDPQLRTEQQTESSFLSLNKSSSRRVCTTYQLVRARMHTLQHIILSTTTRSRH